MLLPWDTVANFSSINYKYGSSVYPSDVGNISEMVQCIWDIFSGSLVGSLVQSLASV